MASSPGLSQDRTTLYPAPKRIKVTSCGDGIEVMQETEKSISPLQNNITDKEGSPTEPFPASGAEEKGEADFPKDGCFETELENKNASFAISDEEWDSIKPRNMPSGGRLLTGPWAHILSEHLRESNPHCSFAFHYNRLKTENSRKKFAPFFKGIGICKIKECDVTVRLLIRGINEKNRLVDVSYSGMLKHRVSAPLKTGYFRNEKRSGMLLLGLGRDTQLVELPSVSQDKSSENLQGKE